MNDINETFERMIAEMRQYGDMPAPSNGGSYNNLLRYREAREKILERFLDAFAEGYRLSKEDDAPTITPPNEWVSVEERLPREKQRVIVRCERVGTSVGWIIWGDWMTDIGPDAGKVTHWMPLPAPPDRRPPERQEDNNEP